MNPDLNPDQAQLDADLDRELDEVDPRHTASLASSLAQLLEIPADLGHRTHASVSEGLLERSLLGTFADLATIGWHTVAVLVAPDDPGPSHNPPDPAAPPSPSRTRTRARTRARTRTTDSRTTDSRTTDSRTTGGQP